MKKTELPYKEINRISWNQRVETHINSDFYDMKGFIAGDTSLKPIEIDLLGDVDGLDILHLQCHFGQDTISLGRMGARVTGVDLSDLSIQRARELAVKCKSNAQFICSDIYDLPKNDPGQFDIVFTTYGTIGWLPDMDKWAEVIDRCLKPGGRLVFVEFHPVVWMFDDNFKTIAYDYFNTGPILETESGTYAEREADFSGDYVMWNHGIGEVVTALLNRGLILKDLREYDHSPYPCFKNTEEFEPGKFRIRHLEKMIPMVYSVVAEKGSK